MARCRRPAGGTPARRAPSAGRGPSRSTGRRPTRCARRGGARTRPPCTRATRRRCAAACRGRRGTRARRCARTPRAAASSTIAAICRSWLCTPPGDRSPSTCSAVPRPRARVGRRDQHRIGGELAGRDRVVDARVVLVDDAAGADVEVPDFRVAHLALGQPDVKLGRVDRRVRRRREEARPVRHRGVRDRVVGRGFAAAEAVEDQRARPDARRACACAPGRRRVRRGRRACGRAAGGDRVSFYALPLHRPRRVCRSSKRTGC